MIDVLETKSIYSFIEQFKRTLVVADEFMKDCDLHDDPVVIRECAMIKNSISNVLVEMIALGSIDASFVK